MINRVHHTYQELKVRNHIKHKIYNQIKHMK
jgi:hypothetical protein